MNDGMDVEMENGKDIKVVKFVGLFFALSTIFANKLPHLVQNIQQTFSLNLSVKTCFLLLHFLTQILNTKSLSCVTFNTRSDSKHTHKLFINEGTALDSKPKPKLQIL